MCQSQTRYKFILAPIAGEGPWINGATRGDVSPPWGHGPHPGDTWECTTEPGGHVGMLHTLGTHMGMGHAPLWSIHEAQGHVYPHEHMPPTLGTRLWTCHPPQGHAMGHMPPLSPLPPQGCLFLTHHSLGCHHVLFLQYGTAAVPCVHVLSRQGTPGGWTHVDIGV